MKILIIGSGGREYALGWKLALSEKPTKLYFAPGNGGTPYFGENVPIKANEIKALARFAEEKKIDLTIVGPEEPLVLGIVDTFKKRNLAIFGPDRFCATLEGSKIFAKTFMDRHHIPTAAHWIFEDSEKEKLISFLKNSSFPIVLKADGLAAGKGVIIPQNLDEALDAVKLYFDKKSFGTAGDKIVVEEFMEGEEATVFVLTDGIQYRVFPVAQDHKRIGDGDTGKNTGGMGAYAPAPVCTPEIMKIVDETIIKPTLTGLRGENHPYTGILYIGLMITASGPKVVEYNVRFGDPECQVEMMLLESDLLAAIEEVVSGKLVSDLKFRAGFASVVVAAANGYPDQFEKGKEITFGSKDNPDKRIFHAGTKLAGGKVISDGGRVLGSVGFGETLEKSLERAYQHIKTVSFDGMVYRKDIGKKGIEALERITK
ncbi:MAG: phosphoribosylamine--glycine ligase [Bacteroidetes bacterium]|nr:phosphoribosylamine--glycine ligase [Bacteroidota bacterium]